MALEAYMLIYLLIGMVLTSKAVVPWSAKFGLQIPAREAIAAILVWPVVLIILAWKQAIR